MGNYEELRASDYLLSAYLSVADDWERFELSGSEDALRPAAVTLCDTFGQLQEDQQFWAALTNAVRDAADRPEEVYSVLSDLGEFRAFEEEVLMALGFPSDRASQLASELVIAIKMTEERPSGETIENLRSRVAGLRQEICATATGREEDTHRRGNRKRRIKQGLKVLAGAAAIVGNGVAAAALPPTLASIVGGVAAIADAATD